MKYTIAQIAEITDGKIINPKDAEVTSVDFDSRSIKAGAIFIPIIAQRDGHDFVGTAKDNGAVATFTQKKLDVDIPQILVENTQDAFWKLAFDYLNQVDPVRIAVTGSNGKTTTKDLISAVASVKFKTHHTEGSFNNELGVPKTILEMPEDTKVLVIELGMDRPGQISDLSNLVNPDISVITMVGEAHIEFFKTRDKIVDAKMEIIDGMPEEGVLLVNGDDPLLFAKSKNYFGQTYTFGRDEDNDFRTLNIKQTSNGLFFNLNDDVFKVNMLGEFNAVNATAAVAVGDLLQLTYEQIQKGLSQLSLTKNRLTLLEGKSGFRVISDVYNSNPTAAIEAVKIIDNFNNPGKKYIVLGDMLELGDDSQKLHDQLIEPINQSNLEEVFLIGDYFSNIVDKLNKKTKIYQKDELNELTKDILATLKKDDLILLKASHGIHLETILPELLN